MKGCGLKCYNKHTGKQTGWPPCRNDDVLPGDLSNNLKNKAKKMWKSLRWVNQNKDKKQ